MQDLFEILCFSACIC